MNAYLNTLRAQTKHLLGRSARQSLANAHRPLCNPIWRAREYIALTWQRATLLCTLTYPAVMLADRNKMGIFRSQQSVDGTEEVTTLMVITVTNGGAGGSPPTTCTDPTATNVGGPLPCVFPATPPLPSWVLDGTVGTLSLWHQGDAIRVCGSKCLVLGTASLLP